jgi:thiamine-phosphate pyrophosphorylase
MRRIGRLHVITDIVRQTRFDHVELARRALAGGAQVIQFREKQASTRQRIEIARQLARLCREAGARLLVNDRLDVALAADADGAHLGAEDFPLAAARDLLGPDRVIGATAGTPEEAIAAQGSGADYVGVGPVYPTASKPDAPGEIGLEGLAAVVRAVEIPVVAVGGITPARVAEVLATGAFGVAVIESVATHEDPAAATRRLREAIDAAVAGAAGGPA